MCGRYVSVRDDADLLSEFDAEDATEGATPEPDYNVAPTKPVRAIVNRRRRDERGEPVGAPVRQLRVMRWGLVPSWAKDTRIGSRMINARAEGVVTASAFRKAYAQRRCLIPADGWYEWQARDGAKQPYFMTPSDGHRLAFAGLYEFWGAPGERITTCTVLTTRSTGRLAEIHDRMPLVLPTRSWTRWLDPAVSDPSELLAAWDEQAGEHLELRPVSRAVNDVKHNGAELVEPAREDVVPQALF